jgi:hypothetical protein
MEPTVVMSLIVAVIAAAVSVYGAVSSRRSAVQLASTAHTIARIDADSDELRTVYKAFCQTLGTPAEAENAGAVIAELEMLRACRAATPRLDTAAEKCGERIAIGKPVDAYWEVNELRDAYREAQGILGDLRVNRLADKSRSRAAATVAD